MHIPDGFIDAPVAIAGGLAAAGLVAVAVRKAAATMDDSQVPLAGLVAAYVFALQMVNFPVAAGTSGHLLGGVLAAVLVGPWVGSLAMTVVFIVQTFVFADGGISALGLNILIMGFVPCFAGYAIFAGLRTVLPRTRAALCGAAAVAAWCGVVLASLTFVLAYVLGGTTEVPIGTVALAMVGVHAVIGIGEAVITGLTIGAVLAVRPDLVYGARGRLSRPAAAPAVVDRAVG